MYQFVTSYKKLMPARVVVPSNSAHPVAIDHEEPQLSQDNIPSCKAHKQFGAEPAQYGLEINFKVVQ